MDRARKGDTMHSWASMIPGTSELVGCSLSLFESHGCVVDWSLKAVSFVNFPFTQFLIHSFEILNPSGVKRQCFFVLWQAKLEVAKRLFGNSLRTKQRRVTRPYRNPIYLTRRPNGFLDGRRQTKAAEAGCRPISLHSDLCHPRRSSPIF